MSTTALRALLPTLLAVIVAVPCGIFIGPWLGWVVLCAGLGLQLASHLRNFRRLERWSHASGPDVSLEGSGAWDSVFSRIYRHEKNLREQIALRDEDIAMHIAGTQALTDGVLLVDAAYQLLFCNTTAETQLGLVLASDRGLPVKNLIRQPEFDDYLLAGEFSSPLMLRIGRGEARVFSIHVIPYAVGRLVMQIKDVTLSDRLDQMRSDFVANVSHELRTPLTVLSGFLETLQELELDGDERQRYLVLMGEQSRRMESIVQDLLTLSSIESAPPPEDHHIDMASLIDKFRRDAEALSAGRHTIVVSCDSPGDLLGSEAELVSAFGNLVANAVRYTPPGGTVRIGWHADRQAAEFTVEDSGIGIDAKHIPRLTERFYRVDRGRSRDAGGTGLGLAIVKHSLNRHQALLDIKSTLGSGSRFSVRFPASRVTGI